MKFYRLFQQVHPSILKFNRNVSLTLLVTRECSIGLNNINFCCRKNSRMLCNVWPQTHKAVLKEASRLNRQRITATRHSKVTPCVELWSVSNNTCVACICVCLCMWMYMHTHVHVETSSISYSMNMWSLFPGHKAAGHKAHHSPHSSTDIKNE